MNFKLEDGTELPEGERKIHRESFTKSQLGQIEFIVIESRFPTVMMLVASGNKAGLEHFPWLKGEYLTSVVAHYLAEGWTLLSMSGDAAAMRR